MLQANAATLRFHSSFKVRLLRVLLNWFPFFRRFRQTLLPANELLRYTNNSNRRTATIKQSITLTIDSSRLSLPQMANSTPGKRGTCLLDKLCSQLQEFRTEALCWSVDPYMRVYVKVYNHPLNSVMLGGQIARVIETRNVNYNVGDIVYAHIGWRTHANVSDEEKKDAFSAVYKLPNFEGLPLSLGLGVLGMPGNTAYFGFLEICRPVAGETVVVSAAAGAVGSHVGQIARIKGCRVIGIAGSEEKVKWLEEELKFDKAINYKKEDVVKGIKEAAPKGVDCYFDNVGGTISSMVISQMNHMGRIAVCGSVSVYNCDLKDMPQAPIVQPSIILNELKMEGFVVYRWYERWEEGIKQNVEWIKLGKLKFRETITRGFENLPKAFIGMLRGENLGKAVVYSSHL